ncbi:MAG: TIGR02301 family protein [Methylovirgula sp.]
MASPTAAQNLLERSASPPPYVEQERPPSFFAPPPQPPAPSQPAPHSAALPPLPGAVPAPGQPAKPGTAPTAPAEEEPAPPYEPQLLRLSELLGALTYLQNLCGGQSGQIWRDKMTALMDAETQNEIRRERLAGAYNRGFKGYELNYRQCTPNAQAIITRFLNESGRIARDVTRRYGTS